MSQSTRPLVLSLAFPDRIAQQRTNQFGRFALANGHGAECRPDDMLGGCEYLVAIDLMRSHSNSSQIHLACELDVNILQTTFDSLFSTEESVPEEAPPTEARFEFQYSISEETMKKYEEVKSLLSRKLPKGASMEQVMDELCEVYLEKHSPVRREKRRQARQKRKNTKSFPPVEPPNT